MAGRKRAVWSMIVVVVLLVAGCVTSGDGVGSAEGGSFVCLEDLGDCAEPAVAVCRYGVVGQGSGLGIRTSARIEIRSENAYLVVERDLHYLGWVETVELASSGTDVAIFAGTDLEVLRPQVLEQMGPLLGSELLPNWFDHLVCDEASGKALGLAAEVCRYVGGSGCFTPECTLQEPLVEGSGRVLTGRNASGSYIFAVETSSRVAGPALATIKRETHWVREFDEDFEPTLVPIDFAVVQEAFPAVEGPLFDGQLSLDELPFCGEVAG